MNTTNLFVELVVVGIGGFIAIAIAVGAMLGFDIKVIEELFSTTALALPALAFIYLFGILFDRISNQIFDVVILNKMRAKYYQDKDSTFYDDKNKVLFTDSKFVDMFEYNRSRQRICRGWALNSVMIILATSFFNLSNPETFPAQSKIVTLLNIFFLLIGVLSIFAWYQLASTEIKRIENQANSIDAIKPIKKTKQFRKVEN